MKKQKFDKITKADLIITIPFETSKFFVLKYWEKLQNLALLESDIVRLKNISIILVSYKQTGLKSVTHRWESDVLIQFFFLVRAVGWI